MPFITGPAEEEQIDYEAKSKLQDVEGDYEFAKQYQSGLERKGGWWNNPVTFTVGAVSDLADTLTSSVGLTNRGDVNQTFLNAVGSPGLQSWYDQNRGALEIGSGIAGVVATGMITKRILAPGSFAMRAIQGVPYARTIAALDSNYARAQRVAMLTARESALRGEMGVERFSTTIKALSSLGRGTTAFSSRGAARNVFRTKIAEGLAHNLTQEGLMAVTMNQNSFLYDDELSHNLAWGALGLGVGIGIDSLVAAHTLRKIANSDAIRQLNSLALDVKGVEAARIAGSREMSEGLAASSTGLYDSNFLFTSGEAITNEITSLALSAKQNQKARSITERGLALFRKREPLATVQLTQAQERIGGVTTRGLTGVSASGFGGKAQNLGKPIAQSIDRDPTFLFGVREIGTTPPELGIAETVTKKQQTIEMALGAKQTLLRDGGRWETKKDGSRVLRKLKPTEIGLLREEIKSLRLMASDSHYAMLEIGEWAPIELADKFSKMTPRQAIANGDLGADSVKTWFREKIDKKEVDIGIGSDGQLFLGKESRKLDSLTDEEMVNLYHLGQRAVNDMKKAGHQFVVQADAPWFVLDMAEQLIRTTENPDAVKFVGNMTRETALVESLAQKVEAIKRKQANLTRAQGHIDAAEAYRLKVFFNLPRLTPYETGLMMTHETPLDLVLAGLESGKQVRNMSQQEITKLLQDAKEISGFTDEVKTSMGDTQGNSFNFMLDYDGNPIAPIIGARRETTQDLWTRDELLVRQSLTHATRREILTGAAADDWNRELVNLVTSDPSFMEAMKVSQLADDQARSFIPGFQHAAPQDTRSGLLNAVTPRNRRDVDNLTLLAASKVKENMTKMINTLIRESVQGVLGDSITLINSPRNVSTKLLLNQFNSYRPGWEILRTPKAVSGPDGKTFYHFVLDHESQINQNRYKEMFGKGFEKGQELLTPEGVPVALDELGLGFRNKMQQLHEKRLAAKNTLLRARNMKEIKSTPWYVEPGSDKGKYVAYMFNEFNEMVPMQKIVANSPEGLSAAIREAEKSPAFKPGYTIRQRDYVSSFLDLYERAQMEFMAPNITAIQPGKKNLGKASSAIFNPQAVEDELVATRDNIARHGNDLLDLLYHDAKLAAQARAKVADPVRGVGSNTAKSNSVWDRWEQNLFGYTKSMDLNSIENRINGLLAGAGPIKAPEVFSMVNDFIGRKLFGIPSSGEKFNKLSQELGQYMPFKTVAEMVEKQAGSQRPAEIAAISSKISWFEASQRLRWFESMNAVINMTGILANTPSVIKALQPREGESLIEVARRNSSIAMTTTTKGLGNIGILNTHKLMWTAMKNAWNPPSSMKAWVDEAIRLGNMDQEVAELDAAWGSIKSREGLYGFLFGDESADFTSKTGFGIRNKIAHSGGIDKWISIITDKSEAFTRQWGMHIGFEVAQKIGITDAGDANSLAKEITDKLIANYDPRNRPEVFQGALGAPFGLFHSYIYNFYNRMFRYIETQDMRSFATQMASQSAIFGVNSLPGWDAVNWAFFEGKQHDNEDPVDSLYRRFDSDTADLLMHGTLSNLPKLVGLPGVNLYTRGDTAYRAPIDPLALVGDAIGLSSDNAAAVQIPVADTLKRLFMGITEGVGQVVSAQGLSARHGAEILTNMIANRPIAGTIETFLTGGYDTDWYGQVVSHSASFAEQTYRVLGIRSMQQQKELETFYADKNYKTSQASKQMRLNAETRARIRAGRYDEIPGLFAIYVRNGGSPAYYTRWVKNSTEAALDSRGERALAKALGNEKNPDVARIQRFLDAGIDINQDDTASDDYGREDAIQNMIQQSWETTPEPEAE